MGTLDRLTTLRMDDGQAVAEFAEELRKSSGHLPRRSATPWRPPAP
ncbi:hypothetical protein ACR6C2_25305 [Streptomyces sp. INA 01156]